MRYLLAFLFLTTTAYATLNEVDKTVITNRTLLVNGGFENGKAKWTASAGTFTVTGTSPMIGLYHGVWDAAASADTLTTTAVTIPAGFYGRNGVASCVFTTASGTATHEIQAYDGSNVLAEQTIVSSTTPVRTSVNFIYPSSGSISLRIYANANEPSIAIDDCHLTLADGFNISNVSQATFVGGLENAGASTCEYAENTSTAISDFVDLGAGSGCAAWTATSNGPGTISAQGTNDHRLVYTNMPPGHYRFELQGLFQKGVTAGGACYFRLSDGTNTYQPQGTGTSGATEVYIPSLTFHATYTTSGTRTFKIQAADSWATTGCKWFNLANNPASWKIYRYPTSAEQVFTAEQLANSWSGYHDTTCSWARTNTALGDPTADASCALVEQTNSNFGTVSTSGSVLPAITFTPKKSGRYYACAAVTYAVGGANSTSTLALKDGSTTVATARNSLTSGFLGNTSLCGIVVATDITAKTLSIQTANDTTSVTITEASPGRSPIEWSIFQLDQSFPQPLIRNGVVSSSSGVVKTVTAYITNSGTPTTTRQDGSWISSLTDGGVGITTVNITSGTFSVAPNCITQAQTAVGKACNITTAATTSSFVSTCFNTNTGAAEDHNFYIQCVGAP